MSDTVESKEFYKEIIEIKKEHGSLGEKVTEIWTDMKHVRRASEKFPEIKSKVEFHNKFIWICISCGIVSFIGLIFYGIKIGLKELIFS